MLFDFIDIVHETIVTISLLRVSLWSNYWVVCTLHGGSVRENMTGKTRVVESKSDIIRKVV